MSDTSLRYDLQTKAALYAMHGIQEVWVIDVNGAALHHFRDPQGSGYREIRSDAPTTLGLSSLPDVSVDVPLLFRQREK